MDLHIEQEINAPAEKVWGILAHQFAEIGNWSPRIKSSRAIDISEVPAEFKVATNAPVPGRVTPNPLGELTEVLTKYSEANMSFTFEVAGPAPLASLTVNNTQVIAKGDDKCLVTFDIKLMPKGVFKLFSPVLKRRLQTSSLGPAGMIKDLKRYVETGQAAR